MLPSDKIEKAWFDGIIDPLEEQRLFIESVLPELEETFRVFAEKTAADIEAILDPIDDAAKMWIEQHAAELARGVTQTTMNALRVQLAEGWEQGEGIEQIARRIRVEMENASRYRSFMIARTETTNAANMGSLSVAQRAGRETKKWYTAMDERTCSHCNALHGVTIGITETFPGGTIAPSLHPQCRCLLLFPVD